MNTVNVALLCIFTAKILLERTLAKTLCYVVVSFDHNIFQRSSSQETEEGSIVTLPQWIDSNSEEDQNVSMEDGYESVD